MSGPKMTIVQGDDWEGLYVDGKLVEETHQIDWRARWVKLMGAETVEADYEWLENRGTLPENLEDVKLEEEE